METDYKLFYTSYLKEFHLVKAINLKKAIAESDQLDIEIKKFELYNNLTKNTKFILQADLRQNYFHSIETFFEFFFAFLPNNDNIPDNTLILKKLVKSDWRKNYKRIEDIASEKLKLNFLDRIIEFNGNKISIGHYMFYLGVFSKEKFPEEIFKSIEKSIDAVKYGIIEIAKDFSNRDEYNAYKHALRIFPSFEAIYLLDAETKEVGMKWDISNSLSFQTYDEKKNKTSIKTKLFDSERDFRMTHFCSNMIYNIISFREIVFCNNSKKREENEKIAIKIFDKESIDKCREYNIEIQNIEFTTELIKKGYS
ncbi:hypothetical protein GCM10011531_13790 [Aquaticitalea lipolytica]|uniref:Uncharacterized protein n=1 Tax=Aquaticitalea lipolytica TaxID=1247562 RepID=A0A8J2TNY6_9FLAO|nr:hypothetical protein [Aquaticitalea lipolytica]GFZ84342.1 hypothetical protein GCM10011531_13790 [Aquaticitalea lipolytica]